MSHSWSQCDDRSSCTTHGPQTPRVATTDSLSPTAWAQIEAAGVKVHDYVRERFPDGEWGGDSCGCTDDRCIGYHHDAAEDCGCLPVLLEQLLKDRRAATEAGTIWAAYRAAVEAGHQVAYEAAWAAAEDWVREYHGPGVVSFSLDALVDGKRGISIRTRWNDLDWLVWPAPVEVPVR